MFQLIFLFQCHDNPYVDNQIKSFFYYVINFSKFLFIKNLFSRLVKTLSKRTYTKKGYYYDSNLLENFIDYEFNGKFIRIPRDFLEILKITYGNDWKIPKKNFNWSEEALNLTS